MAVVTGPRKMLHGMTPQEQTEYVTLLFVVGGWLGVGALIAILAFNAGYAWGLIWLFFVLGLLAFVLQTRLPNRPTPAGPPGSTYDGDPLDDALERGQ